MSRPTKEEQIIVGLIDDMDHEAKVFIEHTDLPPNKENLFKLQIIGENFTRLFKLFEEHLKKNHDNIK